MLICTYPLQDWDLLNLRRQEQRTRPETTELEISDGFHAYLVKREALCANRVAENLHGLIHETEWYRCTRYANDFKEYRMSPIEESPADLNTIYLRTKVLLTATRFFRVTSVKRMRERGVKQLVETVGKSKPVYELQLALKELLWMHEVDY